MEWIIAALIFLGVITSPDQATEKVINEHQAQAEAAIQQSKEQIGIMTGLLLEERD